MRYQISLVLLASIIFCCKTPKLTSAWNDKLENQHLLDRQDSTKWDWNLFKKDLDENKELGLHKPIAFGTFPVPKYELLGKEAFKGVGIGGNFNGLDYNGKKIIYAYFSANRNAINQKYIGNKPDEIFFTIVLLTDFVDTVNYTHGSLKIISRNNPDYIGEGFFKTKNNEIDFTAFITAKRDAYAIVNMRLFNLQYGRTILIAPQKDGSFRSMQVISPVLSNGDIKDYIDNTLKQDDIKTFFLNRGNI